MSPPPDSPAPARELPVWRLLDLGRCEPERAQAFAEAVAESVGHDDVPNTLLFVQPNAPYVSLGFHQSFEEEVDPAFLELNRVPVLRRVEGGGTTYLDPDQLFYQLVYADADGSAGGPGDLRRYLAGPVRATRDHGLAAEFRPPSDIVVGGRKLSGNAGGEWAGAQLIVGNFLGCANQRAMADLLKLPHPALRPLLRREVERWVTSWEAETGAFPSWDHVKEALIQGFREQGLFRARAGRITPAEEARFRTETVPRHRDPSWREIPALPSPPGGLRRRIRVAGPHGILVFDGPEPGELLVGVVDGAELGEGYRIEPGPKEELRPLATESSRLEEVRNAVHFASGFD